MGNGLASPPTRPTSAAGSIASSVSGSLHGGPRRISDQGISEMLSASADGSMHDEILRRWTSEKERREQLEKRNREMAKEIRSLREKLASASS